MANADVPAGFTSFTIGRARAVCATHVADALRTALATGTLFQYAERHPQKRALMGRGVAYAVPLPDDVERVVVRHNRHGGLLAPLTGDLFRPPTRAPRELFFAERLLEYDIPTPKMLGYVVYDALPGFRRADVMTREVPNSFDLSTAFMSSDSALRMRAIVAAADLLFVLGVVGAHHPDLNAKNILLHETTNGTLAAMVLDVDVVKFDEPEMVYDHNLERLLRSARKWKTVHHAPVTEDELDELAALVLERRPPPRPLSTSS
jgi:3-deoxy-D-manno-octulosonic acid kinase